MLEARTLNDPGLRRFLENNGLPATEEWDLARLTLAAFYFSPELDIARGRVAEADASVRTAGARPNPAVSFTPGYNRDAAGVTPWIFGYAFQVPVEPGGKRRIRTAAAQQKTEAARFDLAGIAWAARSAVRRSLVDLHAAEATAALWRSQKPLLADAAKLAQAQVEAGDVSPLVSAQARVALNRAELSARESERAVAMARSRLAEAMGVPLSALDRVRLTYRVLAEVDRASADHVSARGEQETVNAMRESLERQARTVAAQQQAGETSRLDLIRAQIELADNTRAELDARIRAERALAALEDAVQRPLMLPESAWRTPSRPISQ